VYCTKCGAVLTQGVLFCPQCGVQQGAAPPPPAPAAPPASGPDAGRFEHHLQVVAILWIAAGVLRLAMAGGGWALTEAFHDFFDELPFHGMRFLWGGFFGFSVIKAVASLAAGWGLYQRETWARTLALVLAFFSLPMIPLGTALGIYTLWVLLPAESKFRYQRTARTW